MSERLQTESKSNLDNCLTTSRIGQSETKVDRMEMISAKSHSSELDSPQLAAVTIGDALPIDKNMDVIFATLELPDLKVGKSFLAIEHSTDANNRHKPYYSTRITNRSTEKIRIDRFGTYIRKGDILVLHSITGGFFSAQQFQEWYDLGQKRWLEPGQSVTDPNNHSNLNVYWAYFATTASGRQIVAGAPWLGRKHWWQLW